MKKVAAFLLIILGSPWQPLSAQTAQDYARTPEGFYFLLGSLSYQLELCNLPCPNEAVGNLAKQAGVTKEMASNQGKATVAEGRMAAKSAAEKNGLEATCARARAGLSRLGQ